MPGLFPPIGEKAYRKSMEWSLKNQRICSLSTHPLSLCWHTLCHYADIPPVINQLSIHRFSKRKWRLTGNKNVLKGQLISAQGQTTKECRPGVWEGNRGKNRPRDENNKREVLISFRTKGKTSYFLCLWWWTFVKVCIWGNILRN